MLYSKEHKFVFIHIPKTGGTSIRYALRDVCRDETFQYFTMVHQRALSPYVSLGSTWNALTSFAFVRNPWDRMLSYYTAVQGMDTTPADLSFADWLDGNFHPHVVARMKHNFVTVPQTDFIFDQGKQLVKIIGRFERLAEDFQMICSVIGIEASLPHLNTTQHPHYRDFYDAHARKLVAERYASDIEAFGYIF